MTGLDDDPCPSAPCPFCHAEPGALCVNISTLEEVSGAVHPARTRERDRPPMTDLRAEIARTLWTEGAYCGSCDYEPGPDACRACRRTLDAYADAVLRLLAKHSITGGSGSDMECDR
jgi:hypothetical protein